MPFFSVSQHAFWLWIFIGGGVGSCTRYWLGRVVQQTVGQPVWAAETLPWGTIVVNITGCFAIGMLAGLSNGHNSLPAGIRFGLVTGFLGGFTTFSAFGYETFLLFEQGASIKPYLNVLVSVVAGIGAVFTGFYLIRLLIPNR